MTDRPIIFSGPMVRALLDGRKTQTRRLLKRARVFATPERPAFTLAGDDMTRALQGADRFRRLDGTGWFWEADAFVWQAPATRTGWMAHVGYAPGDRLYVRENFQLLSFGDYLPTKARPADVRYAATDPCVDLPADTRGYRWRPCIHMPRWASRLTLPVTEVRIERLQDISEADAIAEGVVQLRAGEWLDYVSGDLGRGVAPVASYASLWNSLHHEDGERWEDNPFVVALTFSVAQHNIDQVPA
jgi:hypothetical protein